MNLTKTKPGTTERWTLDPAHSQVEFGVRHMMISTVKGSFPALSGTILLNEEEVERSSVEVEIQAASIDTGNEDRDAHLRSADFFDAEDYPTLHFRSQKVESTGNGLEVTGDLTIRGETREVVLDAQELGRGTDPWGNPRVAFQAETTVNRKDFGLTWNQALETGGVLVGEEVTITLEVQAIPAEEATA